MNSARSEFGAAEFTEFDQSKLEDSAPAISELGAYLLLAYCVIVTMYMVFYSPVNIKIDI